MTPLRDLLLRAAITIDASGKVSGTGLYDKSLPETFKVVVLTLMGIIGSISVIMVIIGGLQYTLSAGNPAATKKAKDTILFALVGIVVAILAGAIVTFVLGQIK